MPHRSLNTARMEAVAEGAARAEREPGEGRSGDRDREASPDFFSRSLLFEIAGLLRLSIQESRNAREESPEQLFCFIMDKVLTDAIPRTLLL